MKQHNFGLLVLFSLFFGANNFIVSFCLQNIINHALASDFRQMLIFILLFFLFSILYGVLFSWQQKTKAIYKAQQIKKATDHYLDSLLTHKDNVLSLTQISNNLNLDIENAASMATEVYFPLFELAISVVLGALYTLFYSWEIFLFCLFVIPIIALVNHKISSQQKRSIQELRTAEDRDRSFLKTTFDDRKNIYINQNQAFLNTKLTEISQIRKQFSLANKKVTTYNFLFNELGIMLIEFFIFVIGIPFVLAGTLKIGTFLGIWNASIGTFLYPITDLPNLLTLYREKTENKQRVAAALAKNAAETQRSTQHFTENQQANLALKKVSFSYDKERGPKILNQVSLEFPRTGIVYLKGGSGMGKTTLCKLIMGLAVPDEGEINNQGLTFSYFNQQEVLFPATIRENMTLGKSFSEEALRDSCEEANIQQEIANFDQGFDTKLLKPERVSLGQSQRISLARAFLHPADYLILDEPFASLDEASLQLIIKNIQQVAQEKGVIIISHRNDSQLIQCKVYTILKGGEIVEG